MIEALRNKIATKETTPLKLFEEARQKAMDSNKENNVFVTIMENFIASESNSLLNGIPYAIKDNFSSKGILTTASSNILKDYIPVFDSTVFRKLKESGSVLVGKTVLDELAMEGTGITGHTGPTSNPWDKTRLAGGSSSGSAVAVSLGIVPFAIGSDTGDSVRKPATFCGVVGFKPTYGRISRYGLFPFASSLDHVGIFTRNVKDVAIVTDILKGYDEKDMTSLPDENIKYYENLDSDIKGKKLFYIKEICDKESYDKLDSDLEETLNNFQEVLKKCKELGLEIHEVSIDKKLLSAIYPSYFAISCAEATSNNANLTGILFGLRSDKENVDEMIYDTRTKGLSELIKRRFVIGSYILQEENMDRLFLNACRVRRIVVDQINRLFEEYDAMILPSSGGPAPKFEEINDTLSDRYLITENHLAIGNFGGFPSISIPSGFVNNMPVGINITGKAKKDEEVLNLAYIIEEKLGFKDLIAGGKK